MNEREIGGVPLLWGFTTLTPMEVAVHCRWCLAWHHHKLTAPPNVVDYYEAHCYARPDWYDRGYWIQPCETSRARVFGMGKRARGWEARLLAAGETTPSIQRRQAAPGPRPLPPPVDWSKYQRERRPRPTANQWPMSYPTFPEDEDE
ncbi:hypothetical protein [Streptomyces mirabilis]|uniref:hypothetical protein n=1 Tax=Streptomyces mirabilis TaxID=68239 RepID=UPI002259CBA6|nr:hypothetical protein [Streptomyces mirabilis]MCX4612112.1 hypothetical protein [Streptomyces mirabilis]